MSLLPRCLSGLFVFVRKMENNFRIPQSVWLWGSFYVNGYFQPYFKKDLLNLTRVVKW